MINSAASAGRTAALRRLSALVADRVVAAASPPPPVISGALIFDRIFEHVIGKEGYSEPILVGMLSAWRTAFTGNADAIVDDVKILPRNVRSKDLATGAGELLVDVHARNADSNFIVEVQHRTEPLFARRAVLYAAAEMAWQHLDAGSELEADSKRNVDEVIRPVHALAFCDYDFDLNDSGGAGVKETKWRKRTQHQGDVKRAVDMFGLRRLDDVLQKLNPGYVANASLEREMASRVSYTFVMLPHVPPLTAMPVCTPPLLQWASVIAHACPGITLAGLPPALRSLKGIDRLVEGLNDATTKEMITQEEDFRYREQEHERLKLISLRLQLEEEFRETEKKGYQTALQLRIGELRKVGITTADGFRQQYGHEPQDLTLEALQSMETAAPES